MTVPTSREQDHYIMDEIQQLGTYDNHQLFDINTVQIHLRVTTLSDVVDAQGKGSALLKKYSKEQDQWTGTPSKMATTTGYYHITAESLESSS
jgi:hypothetical protein